MSAWHDLAACRPDPPTPENRRAALAVFFPADGDYREAALLCARCPVQPECSAEANRAPKVSHGWWAGSPKDNLSANGAANRLVCSWCGGHVGASGLRRPGKRWCRLKCYQADQQGLPPLYTDEYGDPLPHAAAGG